MSDLYATRSTDDCGELLCSEPATLECAGCGDSFEDHELTDADGLCPECEKKRLADIQEREEQDYARSLYEESRAGWSYYINRR